MTAAAGRAAALTGFFLAYADTVDIFALQECTAVIGQLLMAELEVHTTIHMQHTPPSPHAPNSLLHSRFAAFTHCLQPRGFKMVDATAGAQLRALSSQRLIV